MEHTMKMQIRHCKKVVSNLLPCVVALFLLMSAGKLWASSPQAQNAAPIVEAPPPSAAQPSAAPLTPNQLQDLVAPIALYPDALIAQILAASAYPTQIVEAERFLEQNPNLQGSVKALIQFPSVLADLDKNLSWTSELGDANYNQQADVMAAVQFMREKAEAAGNLKSTPQQSVTDQDDSVVIQPANPDTVYVPDYDPELVYGYPVELWPGFDPWWDVDGPYLSFGVGFGINPYFGFGWGWHAWGLDWRHRGLMYGGGRYAFQSHAFYDRNAYFHGNYRGSSSFARGDRSLRGFGTQNGGENRSSGGENRSAGPGAFGGISHGGDVRGSASRGMSSMGGGRGGGGGMRSGGGGGGRGGGGGHR
jgi:hypothetical protein